jgi:hypothetical protein
MAYQLPPTHPKLQTDKCFTPIISLPYSHQMILFSSHNHGQTHYKLSQPLPGSTKSILNIIHHTHANPSTCRWQGQQIGYQQQTTSNSIQEYQTVRNWWCIWRGGPAIHCTDMGYLPWKSDSSDTVSVKCYYSKDATKTIISPTDIVITHLMNLNAWG